MQIIDEFGNVQSVQENKEKYTDWIVDLGSDGCQAPDNYLYDNGNQSPCIEGWHIAEGDTCLTLRCDGDLAPSFADLVCYKGGLHPPGFLGNTFWTQDDHDAGLFILCAEKDPIPDTLSERVPFNNIKRGMSIWNH